ncbi:membrane fusion protein, Cu(I)/Ag(I) efflux system [Reichenbachiella faecimaris]|uniref:Membrane fusion protein, Cu(I)/Ag(I) efflux system n=1 Tax=Reichenbachiella faecimaris TaxID=692418 RepID=A0A1W2G5J7_REIFA|nr:efflux RND transporter periplasmic adaptor subunit [Reichenbachiella faecimaris]SMD31804.1 membrane fusion protein, Cu(I)/Ag(I) efflux system [Reichenbachiella faecimaris]
MNISIKTLITVALATLVGGLLLGWLFFGGSENGTKEEHNHATGIASETTWTCSMHPQIRSDEPGSCPICGMDLVPVDQDQGEVNAMAVSMSPTAMQLANISTEVVGKMRPIKSLRLNGKVQEDERLVYSQSSHIQGRIEKLNVNFTGEYVRKGRPIAYIYSPDLVTAQEELFEAVKIKDSQPALYQAARGKLKNWKLTDRQIDDIISSGKPIDEFPINADISGYVTQKKVNLGDYINKGQSIYEIANLSKVWVLFDIYESDMAWAKKGDLVTFTIASLPGEEFEGQITYIDPVINPRTRVAKARLEVNNKGLRLKPEMFVSGTLEAQLSSGSSDAVIIPKTAVMWTGKRSVVYVKETTGNGISFLMREVKLGSTLGTSYIIEEGLEQGEEIAVNGTFSIDAAAQLAGKPSMMSPEGGPVMTGHNHGGSTTIASKPSIQEQNKKVNVNTKAKEALKPLLMDYLKIKDALVNDDLEGAKKATTLFQDGLGKINMSVFTGQSHQIWMDYSSEAKEAMQHAAHFQNLGEMRKAFQLLSNSMIGLAKSFVPLEKDIYVQHCPMVDNNKGADWLSLSDEIQNPYFGADMPTCGEITETIK